MEEGRGTQFDSVILDVLHRKMPDILVVHQEQSDFIATLAAQDSDTNSKTHPDVDAHGQPKPIQILFSAVAANGRQQLTTEIDYLVTKN